MQERRDDSGGDQAPGAQFDPQVAPQLRIIKKQQPEIDHITSPLAIRV